MVFYPALRKTSFTDLREMLKKRTGFLSKSWLVPSPAAVKGALDQLGEVHDALGGVWRVGGRVKLWLFIFRSLAQGHLLCLLKLYLSPKMLVASCCC